MLGMTNTIINNLLNHVFHAVWFYLLAIEPKHSRRTTAVISIFSAVLAQLLSLVSFAYFDNKQQALTVVFYVASVTYAIFYIFAMCGGKKHKALFYYFTYICIWSAIYVVVMIIVRNLIGGWEPAVWILRSLFNILLLWAYHHGLKERILRSLTAIDKAAGVLILVSGLTYLLVPSLMIYYAYGTQTILSLVVVIFLLVFCLAVYILIFRFVRQLGVESRLQQIERQNKLLTETVQNTQRLEQQVRQSRHDLRHHIQILLEYAEADDSESVANYLRGYRERELKEPASRHYCANLTVDNILRSYIRKAEQNGIGISTNIRMNEKTAVADIDLVVILGNMLENAINGCMEVDSPRSIEISVFHKENKLVLICKNTCSQEVSFENDLPQRKGGGGVGVSSVLMSTDRYHGDTMFSAQNGIFTCVVLLNESGEQTL